MVSLQEQYEALENEYEAAIAGDHRGCYENELDCTELDSLVGMMSEVKFQINNPDWIPNGESY